MHCRIEVGIATRLLAATVLFVGSAASAQDIGSPSEETLNAAGGKRPYSPYADRNFPNRPLWGDTHLHTSFSMDAGAFGARLDPRDAYRFAKGGELKSSTGQRVRLARPLDFLVVSDHSDNMGFFPNLYAGDPRILNNELGRKWYDMIQNGQGVEAALDLIQRFGAGTIPSDLIYTTDSASYRDAWDITIKAAEEANDPGRFTAFIGYEWTSNTAGNNLHRVVIYRDGAERAGRSIPMITMRDYGGSDNPSRSLELDGRLRRKDRRPRAGHPA